MQSEQLAGKSDHASIQLQNAMQSIKDQDQQ
jgi:hypothetical protein